MGLSHRWEILRDRLILTTEQYSLRVEGRGDTLDVAVFDPAGTQVSIRLDAAQIHELRKFTSAQQSSDPFIPRVPNGPRDRVHRSIADPVFTASLLANTLREDFGCTRGEIIHHMGEPAIVEVQTSAGDRIRITVERIPL